MINLEKIMLPETVEVDGSVYYVQTSFKFWLSFLRTAADKKNKNKDYSFMYKVQGHKPTDQQHSFVALAQFCNPPQILPRIEKGSDTVLDYTLDADYIYSAFLEQYGIDLLTSDMHWYKFQALLRGLHDTKLNEIIGFRSYENKSGKQDEYTRHMEKMRDMWELPQESDEEDEDLKAFEALLYPNE